MHGEHYLHHLHFHPNESHTLPSFYWNVYSSEQRIKYICLILKALMDYQNSVTDAINDIDSKIDNRLNTLTETLDKEINNAINTINKNINAQNVHVESELAKLKTHVNEILQDFSQTSSIYDVTTGKYRPSNESMRRLFQALSYDHKENAQLVQTIANKTVQDISTQTVYNLAYSNKATIVIDDQVSSY